LPTKPSSFSELSLLSAAYDQPEYSGQRKTYLLLTTPRSGSHYLAHSLAGLGYGVPAEYFNAELALPDLMRRWNCSRQDKMQADDFNCFLGNALRHRTTTNGYWGAKIHIQSAKTFFRFPRMRKIIRTSKLVLLNRRDLLGQAISLHIALATKNWFHTDEPVEATYDFDSIKGKLDTLLTWDTEWKRWLSYSGLDYLDTTY
jgi:LPS sulfotransferase NodH